MATKIFKTINVTGKTEKKPAGPYWYWTLLGPETINLADSTVSLPPGTYDLNYDYRGNPGDKFAITIKDENGRELLAISETIPTGSLEGWGLRIFKVEV